MTRSLGVSAAPAPDPDSADSPKACRRVLRDRRFGIPFGCRCHYAWAEGTYSVGRRCFFPHGVLFPSDLASFFCSWGGIFLGAFFV